MAGLAKRAVQPSAAACCIIDHQQTQLFNNLACITREAQAVAPAAAKIEPGEIATPDRHLEMKEQMRSAESSDAPAGSVAAGPAPSGRRPRRYAELHFTGVQSTATPH